MTARVAQRALALALALSAAAVGACSADRGTLPPTGQLLVYVDTDAPADLFDRLRLEVYPPGASDPCAGCTREFGLVQDLFLARNASIGVVPRAGVAGYVVRARLFRSAGTASGEPRAGSTIEVVASLPSVSGEGIVEVTVSLLTDTLAAPTGTLDAPIAATAGRPQTSAFGSWPGAREVPCAGAPRADEACVPGGAFWMGDPHIDTLGDQMFDGNVERLVVTSPFYLDKTEVTVAAFRASGLARSLAPGMPSDDPHERGGDIADCTYTSAPGNFETYPVNCVSWDLAQAYCAQVDKRLPREVEHEYAAGGRQRGVYAWGKDAPTCDDAVFGRGAAGDNLAPCNAKGPAASPVGSAKRDRVALAGGEITDLTANVQEWAADMWNRDTEPCWPLGVLRDPSCTQKSPSDGAARSVRGGHFAMLAPQLRAALRTRIADEVRAVAAEVGFRCARDGT